MAEGSPGDTTRFWLLRGGRLPSKMKSSMMRRSAASHLGCRLRTCMLLQFEALADYTRGAERTLQNLAEILKEVGVVGRQR